LDPIPFLKGDLVNLSPDPESEIHLADIDIAIEGQKIFRRRFPPLHIPIVCSGGEEGDQDQ
jgi:hypothetical protein